MQASVDPPSPWLVQLVAFRDVNHAPSLTQPANQTNTVGAPVSLALNASDEDNDPLTYTASGLPLGVNVNPATGVISGAVARLGAGLHTVTVSVSDGILSTSRTFRWSCACQRRHSSAAGRLRRRRPQRRHYLQSRDLQLSNFPFEHELHGSVDRSCRRNQQRYACCRRFRRRWENWIWDGTATQSLRRGGF